MAIKDTRAYIGVYGGVNLTKAWCAQCECFSFIKKNGRVTCCNESVECAPQKWKRESLASGIRQKPTTDYKREQLARQADRCFYCTMQFGSHVVYRKRLRTLLIHWDHLVPFAYLQTNPAENFVAACQICNYVKSAKLFQTVEEARRYVAVKRALGI